MPRGDIAHAAMHSEGCSWCPRGRPPTLILC